MQNNILCTKLNTNIQHQILFTQSEVKCAELVREIQKRLGYESNNSLSLAIRQSSVANLPIATKDIINAEKILILKYQLIKKLLFYS